MVLNICIRRWITYGYLFFCDVSSTDGHYLDSFIHSRSNPFKIVCKYTLKHIGTLKKKMEFFAYFVTWLVHLTFYCGHLFMSVPISVLPKIKFKSKEPKTFVHQSFDVRPRLTFFYYELIVWSLTSIRYIIDIKSTHNASCIIFGSLFWFLWSEAKQSSELWIFSLIFFSPDFYSLLTCTCLF